MLFSYVSGGQQIDGNKKCRWINGNFDCHGDAAARREAHRPMEHIQGFIAPAAAMVDDFEKTHKTLTKHNF